MSSSNTILCGICQSTIGSNDCTHWSGRGTIDDPFVPTPNIDDDPDNLVRCGPNGLGAFPANIYLDPPACHIYGNIAEDEIVPFDTFWPLAFHDKRYDTDNMFNPDEPGRITINTPGIYDFGTNLRWKKTNDSAATGDLAAFLRLNGAVYLALDSYPVPGADSFAKFSIFREHPFEAGDYIEVGVKQDVSDEDDEPMNLPITIERMSPVFCTAFLRPIEGMAIIGVDTTDANPGGGSGTGGVGTQFALNGTNWWQTAAHSSLDITGDIDMRWAGALTDWTPTISTALINKGSVDGQLSYQFRIRANGRLLLERTGTGLNAASTSTETSVSGTPGFTDGAIGAVRVTLTAATGSVSFYKKTPSSPANALDEIESDAGWTLMETTSFGGAVASFSSTSVLEAGQSFFTGTPWVESAGNNSRVVGNMYGLVVKNGVNGTTVANPDFYHNNSPFTDDAGRTWTKNS